jgi:hypothetical protein
MNQQPESEAIGVVLAAVANGSISRSEGQTAVPLLEAQQNPLSGLKTVWRNPFARHLLRLDIEPQLCVSAGAHLKPEA